MTLFKPALNVVPLFQRRQEMRTLFRMAATVQLRAQAVYSQQQTPGVGIRLSENERRHFSDWHPS